MSGKHRRMLQIKGWLQHIAEAPPGSSLEVGIVWDHGCGWRIYQKMAGKVLALRPVDALHFADVFDEMRARHPGLATLDDTLGQVRRHALDAIEKTKAGERPQIVDRPTAH